MSEQDNRLKRRISVTNNGLAITTNRITPKIPRIAESKRHNQKISTTCCPMVMGTSVNSHPKKEAR
jgi:hypothetical protein